MLSAVWLAVTSRAGRYIAAIAAALGILFAAYRKGGTDAAARTAERRLKEINKARKIEHEVDRRGDDAVHRDLQRWLRD